MKMSTMSSDNTSLCDALDLRSVLMRDNSPKAIEFEKVLCSITMAEMMEAYAKTEYFEIMTDMVGLLGTVLFSIDL